MIPTQPLADLSGFVMQEPEPADLFVIDGYAWRTFLTDYSRYADGDLKMPFSELRLSLAVMIDSVSRAGPLYAHPPAALKPLTAWQPIETAPKDGSAIIVARHMGEFGWIRGHARWEGSGCVSGWVSNGFDPVMSNLGLAHPTHWQPLPPAPEGQR